MSWEVEWLTRKISTTLEKIDHLKIFETNLAVINTMKPGMLVQPLLELYKKTTAIEIPNFPKSVVYIVHANLQILFILLNIS